jgi:glucose/arabinose dehydrogenase
MLALPRHAALLGAAVLLAACRPTAGVAAPEGEAAWQRAFPRLRFDHPLFLTHAPGVPGRLYVATQAGDVLWFEHKPDAGELKLFLDLRARVTQRGGEEGLLGLAFHPDFATNRAFYLYYTPADAPRRTVLSRFRATSADAADAGSEQVLITLGQPYRNHNGGMIAFGPDRQLYVGVGDGGSAGDPHDAGQRLDTLLGKILRVTDDGKAPPDNPFAKTPNARAEIWAYGLRNPWRFSFDRATGALWAADVGQNRWEEIDVVTRGGNYGWRLFEGAAEFRNPDGRPAADFIAPVATYGRESGCSVTGGYVYRGRRVPALRGHYLYADFCSGRVWALAMDGARVRSNRQIGTVPEPSSFGEDADGEVYITSFDGGIYQLVPRP